MNISERERIHTRRELKGQGFGELYERLSDVLFSHNPVGLPSRTGSRDDYGGPVGTLIPRLINLNSVEELQELLYQEMLRWYGKESGTQDRYKMIAQEIWDIWQALNEFRAP